MKTAMAVVAMSLVLLTASVVQGTEVYWTPAHQLAPQGWSNHVMAGDLDGDGDYDVSLMGPQYWNVGTPQLPEWEEAAESPYEGVESCDFRDGALGDLDDDGDLDLVITCYDEHLRFYRNTGTPQVPSWDYEPAMFDSVDTVSGGAEPYLVDLDADDDLDILVACAFGYVVLYMENVGTPSTPEWADRSTILTVGPGSYPRIALGDIDGDADPDLVCVTRTSAPQTWENIGTPEAFEFVENPSMLVGVTEPAWGKGIELFDVDADGDPDLLIMYYLGENFLYLNEGATPVRSTSWSCIKALYR